MLTSQPPSNNQYCSTTPMKRSLQTQQSDPINCPRCDSTNTKFCYYNNYNKTQPRHFCKTCKRHWTKGGTLRNVPVGGGRRNKQTKRANTATPTTLDHGLGLSDQKYMFPDDKGLFFKPPSDQFNQVSWDSNGSNMQQSPDHQNLGFPVHTDMTFMDTNPNPIIPTSFSPILSGFNDDSNLATTRMMTMPDNSDVSELPWMQSTSNFLETNYWTWNETESMLQADLNKPFDDPQR